MKTFEIHAWNGTAGYTKVTTQSRTDLLIACACGVVEWVGREKRFESPSLIGLTDLFDASDTEYTLD